MEFFNVKKIFLCSFVFFVAFAIFSLSTKEAYAVAFTRKVFLQNATPTSIDFRWVTDTNEALIVKYGVAATYGSQVNSDTATGTGGANNHAKITGLTPGTKYFYQVTTSAGAALTPAGDQNYYFKTAPSTGAATPFTFAIWGDSGSAGSSNTSALSARKPDITMVAGDIGYPYSSDFNNNNSQYFNVYGSNIMRFSPFYVTCGNHETSCSTVMADHSLPGNGNMGGQVSTYAWDYGNVHFVALNSNGSYSYPSDSQMAWALSNLRASNQPWKVIFWHHNGWSAGSHSTDQTRQDQIGRLATDGGADLVFWGHSHSFERWNRKAGFYPDVQFYTIGDGGKTNSTSCTATSPGPGCAAKDSGPGFIFAEVNGNQMTLRYITGGNANPDTITMTSNGTGPTSPPVTNPPATVTPTRPPNATNTPTRPVTPQPTGNCPPANPGDSNNDQKVDGIDFTAWLNHYNQSFSCAVNGDFNNSGRVDGVDFSIWLANYNGGTGTNPTVQILSPANGSTVSPNFSVQFSVTNWIIGQ